MGGEIIGGGDEFDLPNVDAPQHREPFHSLSLPHVGGEMIFGKVATDVDVVAHSDVDLPAVDDDYATSSREMIFGKVATDSDVDLPAVGGDYAKASRKKRRSDVTDESGPHECVPFASRPHLRTTALNDIPELARRYGQELMKLQIRGWKWPSLAGSYLRSILATRGCF